MSLRDDAIAVLGASPLGQNQDPSRRQPTTRLDTTGTKEPESGYSKAKIIRSGKMIETYEFQYPVWFGKKKNIVKKTKRGTSKRSEEHRKRSVMRAIQTVKRLSTLNFTFRDKFLTLTFRDTYEFDINSLDECLLYYKKFIRKLRKTYPEFKFIAVPEFQKRGAVHYHLLCDIPYTKQSELATLWPYGFSKINAISNATHLALYLCKYLSKKFDDGRKLGHRLFYSSRGLKRPKVTYGPIAESLSSLLKVKKSDAIQYGKEYSSEVNGLVTYTQYSNP